MLCCYFKSQEDLEMSDKDQRLAELDAGEFEHLDVSLIEHLSGTKNLLQQWEATIELQDAGLYHAAYGTSEFTKNLVSINQRDKVAGVIGQASEELVYQYCACDREVFFPRIGQEKNRVQEPFHGRVISYLG